MRVAVRKIDGVDSVAVSLQQGLVVIRLRPDNRVTLERVRDVIREGGFTPKDAEVRARGTVVSDSGHLALALPGIGVAFHVIPDSQSSRITAMLDAARGHAITIEGRVPETPRGVSRPSVLEVRGVSGEAMR